jgi:hypothetical protein
VTSDKGLFLSAVSEFRVKLHFNQRGADAPFTPVNLFFLKRKDSKENRFDEK